VSNTVAVMRGEFHMFLKAKRTSCHRFMRPLRDNQPWDASWVPSLLPANE
jgi:hypothetical protein